MNRRRRKVDVSADRHLPLLCASNRLPPYEVPAADADLLEAGVVITRERLVETWSHNLLAHEWRKLEWQKTLVRRRRELLDRKKSLRLDLLTQGESAASIRRILKGVR